MHKIANFCDSGWHPKRTATYKKEVQDIKEYIDELVCYAGSICLMLGLEDGLDDYYYILADFSGRLKYVSDCIGIDYLLKKVINDKDYKELKKHYITQLLYQREWRVKAGDKSVVIPESKNHITVDQFLCDGVPVIRQRVTDISKFRNSEITGDYKKIINCKFWRLFLHRLGYHNIMNVTHMMNYEDEVEYNNSDNFCPKSITVGYCSVCKGLFKVKTSLLRKRFDNWYFKRGTFIQKKLQWLYELMNYYYKEEKCQEL